MRVTVRDLSRKVNYLNKVVWGYHQVYQFHQNKLALTIDVEVSKDKHISRWVDWENLIYVRWIRIKNHA